MSHNGFDTHSWLSSAGNGRDRWRPTAREACGHAIDRGNSAGEGELDAGAWDADTHHVVAGDPVADVLSPRLKPPMFPFPWLLKPTLLFP
ncbi:hypothetical protein BZL29_8564 [Mycobacterium kansasii]|uniref:Uncharacterized protein n=1 Tax=Mycobacterium kansasii TaxID=1768 RepID=A0A1V3WA55_MYCKA|nr:hypothetical protein BZL29_8564 [Mycobacterium kansasii]